MDFRERIIRKLIKLLDGRFHDYGDLKDKVGLGVKKTLVDNHSLRGNFHFRLWDTVTGETVQEFDVANTVTEGGDAQVADAMGDDILTRPSHMAVGDGVAGGADATTLTNELHREVLTATENGTGGDDNDVIWTASFLAGHGTGSLTEAGVFNDGNPASAQIMTVISGFGVITKDALMQLDIVWTLTCGAS